VLQAGQRPGEEQETINTSCAGQSPNQLPSPTPPTETG
jgi:hypothetical protein